MHGAGDVSVKLFVFRRDLRTPDNTCFLRCRQDAARETTDTSRGKNGTAVVVPIFVYNLEQLDRNINAYHSSNSVQFLRDSLVDLERQLKRELSENSAEQPRLRRQSRVDEEPALMRFMVRDAVEEAALFCRLAASMVETGTAQSVTFYWNADLTPYARARDARNRDLLTRRVPGCTVLETEDYTLFPVGDPDTKAAQSGEAYRVFAPFFAKRRILHSKLVRAAVGDYRFGPDAHEDDDGREGNRGKKNGDENDNGDARDRRRKAGEAAVRDLLARDPAWQRTDDASMRVLAPFYERNANVAVEGGRAHALEIVNAICGGAFSNYEATRNALVDEDGTTRLSAYIKYGCIGVREVYRAVVDAYGIDHPLLRQLYFRDFYYALAWFHPRVLAGMAGARRKNEAFDLRISDADLAWSHDEVAFGAWKHGRTGTPLVDAGMRQMNATGFMHNRARMVVAMYLTKELYVDWRLGERYFATKLVDYDPINNSAGWQWSASVGCDAAPYFRVLNPFLQQKRFDPRALYVKKWVPELRGLPPDAVSRWDEPNVRDAYAASAPGYPAPLVAQDARKRVLERVKNDFKRAFAERR